MKKDISDISRRKFLQKAALAGITAPLIFSHQAVASKLPGKVRHVAVGVGGMGWHDLNRFMSHPEAEIVAICDVDANHLKRASEALPNAKTYTDWRELLKNESGNFDSINVSVPDHNHFAIAFESIKMGKHVYCQKPMCHDVAEVRALTIAANNAGIVSQLGTQHASGLGDRTAVQWIKE
ncbi:MAG TPA: Gfo/Idh/MocA family oxidoreductase, partial [Lunatimonas sp.]|nr:Gfo/Idh/MocA family oxidoreductase [Lunatimonas sp.]